MRSISSIKDISYLWPAEMRRNSWNFTSEDKDLVCREDEGDSGSAAGTKSSMAREPMGGWNCKNNCIVIEVDIHLGWLQTPLSWFFHHMTDGGMEPLVKTEKLQEWKVVDVMHHAVGWHVPKHPQQVSQFYQKPMLCGHQPHDTWLKHQCSWIDC